MRTVEFHLLLDDRNAMRVNFELEQGRVLKFVIQLECRFNDKWNAIVRYDTAHNFAHRDLLHPSGETEKSEMITQNYNEALTFAIKDLTDNWEKYRQRYEQWLKQR
jgi:hypothetical protein